MNDEQKKALNQGVSMPKVWTDLTADEKIERMRDEVKNLHQQLRNRNVDLFSLRKKFHKHMHSADGKVVSEIQEFEDFGVGAVEESQLQNSKGIYF